MGDSKVSDWESNGAVEAPAVGYMQKKKRWIQRRKEKKRPDFTPHFPDWEAKTHINTSQGVWSECVGVFEHTESTPS